MELQNPKKYFAYRYIDVKQIEKNINQNSKYVSVNNLTITDIKAYEKILEYQENKIKAYACFVTLSDDVNDQKLHALQDIKDL